ncbi:MAG: hypothetical protein RXR06_12145 [Thermoproteus sp.]
MSEQNPNQTTNPAPAGGIYAYTQHEITIRIIETMCNIGVIRLKQDRNKDPVEDVLSQLPPAAASQNAVLYAVLPPDKAVALKAKAPKLKLILLQLDGKTVERLTGKPYDPKADYPPEVLKHALKTVEVKSGSIRYLTFEDLSKVLNGKTVAVFNDTMREALQRLINATFVKSCDGCVEINPLGLKSGIRISLPGPAGRLTAEQMAEMIAGGQARIYYAEVVAEEVGACP